MSDKNGVGVTVVSHDSEGPTKLMPKPFCRTWDVRTVTYAGATVTTLGKLADISEHCEQFVRFECRGEARCWREIHTYWVSRDRKPMYYWGGAAPGSWKCACGMNETCAGVAGCNCNQWSSGLREDSGLLTDKSSLPVTQLRFASFFDESSYAMGKFKCNGGFINADRSCVETNRNKVLIIDPDNKGKFPVYCDHSTTGGGWIVIQKRFNGSTNFGLPYDEYKNGFGDLEGEVWLGLNKIHRLTSSGQFPLRIELEDWDGNTAFAEYDNFVVGDERSKYKLVKLGRYKGTTGDSLFYYKGKPWSTSTACVAWWLKLYQCDYRYSNLNGKYIPRGRHDNSPDGVTWSRWKGRLYSLKKTEMKIRLITFV